MNNIEVGQELELHIEKMASKGQGIARYNGMTVFVEKAIADETVQARVTKVKKDYSVALTVRVLEKSTHRIDPLCPVSEECGGCQLQHMDYEGELAFKKGEVKDALRRLGHIDVEINDVIGMDNPCYYRNKAEYPVAYVDGKAVMGLYKVRSHDVVPIDKCMIQNEKSQVVAREILDFIRDHGISVYDERTKHGLVRHIMTRCSRRGEVMAVVVAKEGSLPYKQELIVKLKTINGFAGLILNINPKETNVVLGDKNILLYGEDRIVDKIGDLEFYISPASFFQVNPVQTEILYSKVLKFAALQGNELVIDAYCGVGTISLFLAQRAYHVIGIEAAGKAVRDAKENARLNDISNADFIAGRSENVMEKLIKQDIKPDVIVVDPPRKGCDAAVLKSMGKMSPKRIVYVSCNPSTLARDLKQLSNMYSIKEVQPVDMFPRTAHVEIVVLLQRGNL